MAGCTGLRHLHVPYTFPVEHYADLTACLPETDGPAPAPGVDLPRPSGGRDVPVDGRRKPFLNAARDAEQLAKHVAAFEALVEGFRGRT